MAELTALRLLVTGLGLIMAGAFLRLLYILPATSLRPARRCRPTSTSHILIVLGSGGHTAEMFSLIRDIDPTRYTPRTYVISAGDAFSASKAMEFEATLAGMLELLVPEAQDTQEYKIVTIPRARKIHQSLLTTPISSLRCLWACFTLFAITNPRDPGVNVVLTNGPATGVMVVLAAQIVRFFGIRGSGNMKSIYVESWARVKTLSLSGNILLWGGLTDRFFVQWEGLKGGRKEWRGFLVG